MQALALTTLAKIVAAAGADRIRPHLPELVPALLEALSRTGGLPCFHCENQ